MGTLRKFWAKKNMPGSRGYNSRRGSGPSYYTRGKFSGRTRNKSGGLNLLG